VTQWQNLFYEDRYAHTHQRNPDFMKLADSMGVQGRRLVKPEEVREGLQWLIDAEGPALLEVVTDKKVPVLPMVPTGAALHEFIAWDSGESSLRPAHAYACVLTYTSQGSKAPSNNARADGRAARLMHGALTNCDQRKVVLGRYSALSTALRWAAWRAEGGFIRKKGTRFVWPLRKRFGSLSASSKVLLSCLTQVHLACYWANSV
jgi:hypothetical protein